MKWKNKEVSIGEIDQLLKDGYEIEVDSPDGYIPVNFFINKGLHEEFILEIDDHRINPVRCNGDHLFETSLGWVPARELNDKGELNFLTKYGWKKGFVYHTGEMIPIVDINVEHENHRYYTHDVSSHNTGVGKSLIMCHMAAAYLSMGYDVLYITAEMAEERIAERIDANLLDVNINRLQHLSKDQFSDKVLNIKKKTTGKLIIKEYPTGQANVNHIRSLLNELKLKKRFKPQVILLDYLNIFSSSRLRSMGGSINSYTYIKAIAEEFRGLAVEFELPIVSATQTTRSGAANSDPEMGDTSESFGLPATVDLLLAAIRSEELDADDQIMFKQLKSRYGDINNHKRFVVGIDRGKMKLFDAEVQDIINENNMSDVDKTVAASKTLGLDFKNGDIIF